MSPIETKRGSESRPDHTGSVLGSKVSDTTNSLWSRRLPRGGIRETDGLKVDGTGLGDSGFIGSSRERGGARSILRIVAIVSGVLIALMLVVLITLYVLSHTSAFKITSVKTYDSEHVTADMVAQLAVIPEDATLLTVDEEEVAQSVKKNPWVASVTIERNFPDTLRILVKERTPSALVSMGTGGLAWLLATDGIWIEPLHVEVGPDESMSDACLREADARGILLILDVPQTVSPAAGYLATDEAIEAVWSYREQLSSSFMGEVVAMSAASGDDISCILRNGVEVSFGSTSNIEAKERVARGILDSYTGQVTYINVRVPTRATYRRVNSEYVREGTGATGSSVDEVPLIGGPVDPVTTEGEEQGAADAATGDAATGEATTGDAPTGDGTIDGTVPDFSYGEDDTSDYDTYSDYGDYGYDSYGYDDTYGYDEGYDSYGTDDYGYDDYGSYDDYSY